ncbi:MAG: hypothetical protein S4CHLAM123_15650 [Chlamydiales bacterium]|nr:hypothetical protein [Chlamydiales bacterium]
MISKFFVLALSFVSFVGGSLHAEFSGEMPKETAILQLPDHSESNWKEITRYVSAKEGVIEAIPRDQTIQNWSELIAVQYMSSAEWDKSACNLEKVLEHVRKETLSAYPKDTVSWQIIEKDKEGIIYEWIMHKPYKNISVEHQLARAFLTSSGFHCVGFIRKNGPMSAEERAKWIQLLRENSSVVSIQDGSCIEGFSMVERL